MAENEANKPDKFDFDSAGEALGYISLEQARLLAMQTTRDNPGNYGRRFAGVQMVFQTVEQAEGEDYYFVTLSFRPEGDFRGTTGQEEFVIEKEGAIAYRQVLSLPRGGGQRHLPAMPTAIGLLVVIVAAVGAAFATGVLGDKRDEEPPIAGSVPTNTPSPAAASPQRPAVPGALIPQETTPVAAEATPVPTPTATQAQAAIVGPTHTPTPIVSIRAPVRVADTPTPVPPRPLPVRVGDTPTPAPTPPPPATTQGLTLASVSASSAHTCGVTGEGTAYCWAYGANGRLGNGSKTKQVTPVQVSGGLTFVSVNTGRSHTCGITNRGAAYCWGANTGALGHGDYDNYAEPVPVSGGLTFTSVIPGTFFTCGITANGDAYCWGTGDQGRLGNNLLEKQLTPVPVSTPG